MDLRLSRRRLLGVAGAAALAGTLDVAGSAFGSPGDATPSGVGGGRSVRRPARVSGEPGSLPDPTVPAGTDLVPQIENFIVVMMENHSFDNLLGMLGRGDCFPKGPDGLPTVVLPDGHGNLVRAFHMPSECQTNGVGNNWNLTHHSWTGHTNQGCVEASSGESVGYFDGSDLPFTWSMAATFPIADRWFASVPGQTDPNRRYLFAGTSLGEVADVFPDDLPPNGTIFDSLNRHGATWKNYFSNLPSIGVWLPLLSQPSITTHMARIDAFFVDAAAGDLPQFTFLEPNYSQSSEENPQDIQYGDQFLGEVVNAVMSGPQWSRSMLIWTYDEWGGWYDHVSPPGAVPPDDVPPNLTANMAPGGFDRYGFRVPAGVVSPFARPDFVSHELYDHTSVLKTLEVKWNFPALTRRDAHARDLFDMIDLEHPPAFATPPTLVPPANPALTASCLASGPGRIPPRSAVESGAVIDTPHIRPPVLPGGIVGSPYHASLEASPANRHSRWAVLSDDLPPGLVLDVATGAINGVPTSAGSFGTTIGVRQDRGPVGVRSYTVVVAA